MFPGPALDILYDAFNEVAQANEHAAALTVVGDFGQLPPITDRDPQGREIPETAMFAFEGNCWRPNFSPHTKRLTQIWRQDNEGFVHALQAARRGAGDEALTYLRGLGVRFEQRLSTAFEGTTLCAHNDTVDTYNMQRLYQLPGDNNRVPAVTSTRWAIPGPDGRPPKEWEQIPETFPFKLGAYVMILSNNAPTWANGDCGTLVSATPNQFVVRLKRNGREVNIGRITRTTTTRTKPAGILDADVIALTGDVADGRVAGSWSGICLSMTIWYARTANLPGKW